MVPDPGVATKSPVARAVGCSGPMGQGPCYWKDGNSVTFSPWFLVLQSVTAYPKPTEVAHPAVNLPVSPCIRVKATLLEIR